jgi:hypothetical protein
VTLLPLVPPDEMPAPRGVYPIPLELEDGEQEALLWTDDAGTPANVLKVNLVDDEIVIGSSARPIALKVYDATLGMDVTLGSGIAAPRKFSATAPTGTVVWLLNFEGNLNDSSSYATGATLGGVAGGVARYPYYVGPGGAVRGFLFDGQTWLTRSLTGASQLDITGAITVEALIAPMALQQFAGTDTWLGKYGVVVSCSNSTGTGTPFQYSRWTLINGASSDTYRKVRWGHEAAGTAYLLDDDDSLPPGPLQVLTATRDSAGTALKIYLNGYEVASTTVGAAPSGTAPNQVSVGANVTATATDQYTFTGFIASLRVTNAEFSAAQVLSEAKSAMGW